MRVLIAFSHFSPAYKAGGPVQSIVSLVSALGKEIEFFVICSARDLGEHQLLPGVVTNQWTSWSDQVNVYYCTGTPVRIWWTTLRHVKPDAVYINGMFLPAYNWMPALFAWWQGRKLVIAPRGMLQSGALATGALKKGLILTLMKLHPAFRHATWHATDSQEWADIQSVFGAMVTGRIITNIPRTPWQHPANPPASKKLRLVYLSLIARKKNLLLLLEAISTSRVSCELDVYGPIKDTGYWADCQQVIDASEGRIRYCGPVPPDQVQQTLSNYHAFMLPTKGENFGHAIYDALSVGTPVVLSRFTPWTAPLESGGGWVIENTHESIHRQLGVMEKLTEDEWLQCRTSAHQLAVQSFVQPRILDEYKQLFA